MRAAAPITRRSVLAASLAVLAGCTRKARPTPPAGPAPDAAALAAARTAEEDLLAAYDGALSLGNGGKTTAALTAARQAHAAHLAALGATPATPTPAATAPSTADLHEQLLASVTTLHAAAVAATSGPHAALLASIAASHSVLSGE